MIRETIIPLLVLITAISIYFVFRRTSRTYRALSQKRYSKFVYTNTGVDELGIPVFVYHSIANRNTPDSVTPAEFKRHMRYLADNNYQTLSADELYNHLVYGKPVPSKSVVITFDDGRATFWIVAFPILKKYNFKAVTFIVPGSMCEKGVRPTLEEKGGGFNVSLSDLLDSDLSNIPAITWDEAKIMHNSGLADFQSHTLNHSLIYSRSEVVDFINPSFHFNYNNYGIPVILYNGVDSIDRRPPLGTPIYRSQPRMSATRRFFDDERLRSACVNYVEQNGVKAYFARTDWRDDLFHFVKKYRIRYDLHETCETEEEQVQEIRYDLIRSKKIIEENLPNHVVRHLCYPWNRYSVLAATLAREVGYVSAFIDINPQKPFPDRNASYLIQRVLPINEPGDDPFQITRIDARDNLILSLPGTGRITYLQRVALRLLKLPGFLNSILQKASF